MVQRATMAYNFTLLIDSKVLQSQPSDIFGIARKVNGRITTLFQSGAVRPNSSDQKHLQDRTSFDWEDKYRVFATSRYQPGIKVSSDTKPVEIKFGEETSYKEFGFSSATPAPAGDLGHPEDSFLAKDIPSTHHVGVQCLAGGAWFPVYVDPEQHFGPGNYQLTPGNEYLLFWADHVETATVIDEGMLQSPKPFKFDNGVKTKTIRFGYKESDKPEAQEHPAFYDA